MQEYTKIRDRDKGNANTSKTSSAALAWEVRNEGASYTGVSKGKGDKFVTKQRTSRNISETVTGRQHIYAVILSHCIACVMHGTHPSRKNILSGKNKQVRNNRIDRKV